MSLNRHDDGMSNTPGKVRNAEEQALPEKSGKAFSDNISAKSQKQRLDAFKALGMDLKKAFLGQDTLKKLAVIYEVQYGEPLNTNDMSYEVLGDLLSFCVNKCYNLKEMKADRKKALPTVKAAMTPAEQLLYRYYQMAMSVDGEELEATTDKFNVENKEPIPLRINIFRSNFTVFIMYFISIRQKYATDSCITLNN